MPELQSIYKFLKQADPDHPTWSVFTGGQVAHLNDFVETFDSVGSDPYPIGVGPRATQASEAREYTTYTAGCDHGVCNSRPVWMVIQAFNHNNTCCPLWPKDGSFHTPTLQETRSMAWQAICAGANGIVFYSFFEALRNADISFANQWAHFKTLAAEIDRHATVLLGPMAPNLISPAGDTWRMTRAHWADEGKGVYMVFAVSDGTGGGLTTFELPWTIQAVEAVETGGQQASKALPHDTKRFNDTIAPLGLAVYKVTLLTAPADGAKFSQRERVSARVNFGSACTSHPCSTASTSSASSASSSLYPLVKKFQAYNAGLVMLDRLARDAHLLHGLGAKWMRVDGGLGWDNRTPHLPGVFGSVVEAGPLHGTITLNSQPIAEYTAILAAQDVRPVYSWAYTPTPFRTAGGDWRSGPNNITLWSEMHRQLAKALIGTGAVHELYNEPDLDWALNAPWTRYLDMYKAGAEGIRAADPAAQVIGPAMALYPTEDKDEHAKLNSFLTFVDAHKLPLDALSIHAYGAANWSSHLDTARTALKRGPPSLAGTKIHLNEINSVDTTAPHAEQYASLNNYTIAASVLGMVAELIAAVDVEQVHWAQFQEPGADPKVWGGPWGMIDVNGTVKASYNAFNVYNRMPIPASLVVFSGGSARTGTSGASVGSMVSEHAEVTAMASVNASRAALVLWSTVDSAVNVTAEMLSVPFQRGHLTVYRIDADHCSYGNSHDKDKAPLAPAEPTGPAVPTANLSWAGELPPRAVLYLELNAQR
jgi:hypothetical protein